MNSSDIYVDPDNEPLKGLMVSRPAGEMRLWEALLTVLQMGQIIIFWPGSPPLIAIGTDTSNFPEGMREGLGEPVRISQPEQFLDLLKTT